ncbi:reverse transcriptase domain-containing protein [Thioalkalivibrio sp. ALJ1]|uniref:reverse transcriptase domain-containing protein n=1 Tax=Thioalkalivibrio sp. ALJ1 TaxID=1158144 RepID=UPI0009DD86F9|nr:reverse transcriptase domain-containing protein [Thioalkalivibrio sp. ALJ1]
MNMILGTIAAELEIEESDLRKSLDSAAERKRYVKIPKKSGDGFRRLVIPPQEHKLIQYWTTQNILSKLALSPHATAFHKGASVVENARRHAGGIYFVRMDISDFFPSIESADLIKFLLSIDSSNPIIGSADDRTYMDTLFHDGRCAIGYPISPHVANLVMKPIDDAIADRLNEESDLLGNPVYTRYADDITISISRKGFKSDVLDIVRTAIHNAKSPSLKINNSKTKFGSRLRR